MATADVRPGTRPNPKTSAVPSWRMALDIKRCMGCHACSVACKVENEVPLGRFRTKVRGPAAGDQPANAP